MRHQGYRALGRAGALTVVLMGLVASNTSAHSQPCEQGCHVRLYATQSVRRWISPQRFPVFKGQFIAILPTLGPPPRLNGEFAGKETTNCRQLDHASHIILRISTCGNPGRVRADYVTMGKPRSFWVTYYGAVCPEFGFKCSK